jgi:hypothetical protein
MARKTRLAPASPAKKSRKTAPKAPTTYWASVVEPMAADEFEPVPPNIVHGVRRAEHRRRIY